MKSPLHSSSLQHQANAAARKPHPRIFVVLCGVTIFVSLILYSVFILYPSYQSGIYRSEEPTQEVFRVPFYSYDTPGFVNDKAPIWTVYLFVDIVATFFFPPLSLALLVVLVRHRQRFTVREQLFWTLAMLIAWIGFITTFSAAVKFGVWVAD